MAAAVVTGLACSNNQAKTDETAVKQDSSAEASPGYKEQGRDTSMAGASDSAKSQSRPSQVSRTRRQVSLRSARRHEDPPRSRSAGYLQGRHCRNGWDGLLRYGPIRVAPTNSNDSTGMSVPGSRRLDGHRPGPPASIGVLEKNGPTRKSASARFLCPGAIRVLSDHSLRGLRALLPWLPDLLSPLPVRRRPAASCTTLFSSGPRSAT